MKNAKTLTEGPLAKQILLVSLPLALSNLLQVLFNMSDVAVVGRFAGSTALGAVETLLEKRLAICMTCGRVGSWKNRPTFEELAIMFEGSTASGAERAYRKAADKLTELLVAEGALHAVRLKQKSKTKRKKKIAAAIYEYQADCDGEWGEISFDFENGTAEIIRLADWDTIKTNRFANKAVAYLLNCENEKLPKETMVAFE